MLSTPTAGSDVQKWDFVDPIGGDHSIRTNTRARYFGQTRHVSWRAKSSSGAYVRAADAPLAAAVYRHASACQPFVRKVDGDERESSQHASQQPPEKGPCSNFAPKS